MLPIFLSSTVTSPLSSRLINTVIYLKLPLADISNWVSPERSSWYLFPRSSTSHPSTSPVNSNSTTRFAMSIAILSRGLPPIPSGLVQLPPNWSFFFQSYYFQSYPILQSILHIATSLLKTLHIFTLPLE